LSSRTLYLTTPIYYASGEPHIGHAYTTFLADALARLHRADGSEVYLLTGTDEHGQKIQEEAERRGVPPLEFCDAMALRFREAWGAMDISFDRFIRTTEPNHVAVVTAFLDRLWASGEIYEGEYTGWYSVHEERYFTEKEIGPDRTDPVSGRPLQKIEETNYFFRMSAYQERLVRHIEENPDWIVPESRRNEILGFLQKPLEDLSISRPRSRVSWGIPLPFAPEHVTYVWVDALINYLTASDAIRPDAPVGAQGFDDVSDSRWPADLHIVGKDIITTHAVYWPTLLMAAGLPLPKQILAHGWWVVGETKMSKSLGNVVDPLELRSQFGTDAVRWFLLREMPVGQDASYTPERFLTRYEELANVLGNLLSRSAAMIAKYRGGVTPDAPGVGLSAEIDAAVAAARDARTTLMLHEALAGAMELARAANGYLERSEPWTLAKSPADSEKLDEVLASVTRALIALSSLFYPAIPEHGAEMISRLGLAELPPLEALSGISVGGLEVRNGEPLFPRIEPGLASSEGAEDSPSGSA